jgi:integrase
MRPRQDGTPTREPNKRKLSELFLQKLRPQERPFLVWDTQQRGLALAVRPKGHKSWKVIYAFHGRPRWYHLGDAAAIGLADARRLANRVMFAVAEGKDPAAERKAERSQGTFEELATRYLEEHAKKKNKSWHQADALVRRHLIPKWGRLSAHTITRADVKKLMASIEAPVVANQTLAAASAIFSWAIREDLLKLNPCKLVARNDTKSRERVLSDSEIEKFWNAFDASNTGAALKMILLTGQRPGEATHMRYEHIVDGWWEMPGAPVPALGWPGTKNGASHRLWLPQAAQQLLTVDKTSGFVFTARRGSGAVGKLATAMRDICKTLGVERATPHDLRRTHGTMITRLGFGRDIMNRIQNHAEGGIASVYDRHQYAEEIKRTMEAVAQKIMTLVEGITTTDNVTPLLSARSR